MPGKTLELGVGPGFFAPERPEMVRIDIRPGPCAHAVADAHALPFKDDDFANVVGIDTLHHLAKPGLALAEAARLLRPGGRLILVEPWTGPVGWLIYRFFHHEMCEAVPDPLLWAMPDGKDPMIGNAVIAKAVFVDGTNALRERIPDLSVTEIVPFGVVSFLSTGGFQKWSLPWPLVAAALRVETMCSATLMRFAALRVLIVLEKSQYAQPYFSALAVK